MILTLPQHFEFPHRTNQDGTIDSICPHCYLTVGRSTWEAELERIEAAHVCQGKALAEIGQQCSRPFGIADPAQSAKRLIA
jgi:hypothetical protein